MDFFGISGTKEENTTKPGEDEEDYWEIQENLTTIATTENQDFTKTTAVEELEGSGEDPKNSDVKPNVIQGTKNVENSIIEDELIVDKSLAKFDGKEKAENEKNLITVETFTVETTRTTKPDPLEKLDKIKGNYVEMLEQNMKKLEKMVDVVEKMIDPSDALKVVDDEEPEIKPKNSDKQVRFEDSSEFGAPVFGTFHPRIPNNYRYNHDDVTAVDHVMLEMLNHLLSFNPMPFMGAKK